MITAARISPSGTKKPLKREVMRFQAGGVTGEAVSCLKDFLLSISDTEALRNFTMINLN